MSDTEKASTTPNGKGWTDRQRLAYYFSFVEHSNVKLDFLTAPRPAGKSVGACRIMVDRLKGTLKADLAALRDGTPTKRGRKKKKSEEKEVVVADEEE
ncbi:hypothetical protein PtrEW13061_010424 [Pyrenophora tritici-repentis]|nr:hypothetical protein PtrEW13061_010424 [Pyrenophora tritici-repentis]